MNALGEIFNASKPDSDPIKYHFLSSLFYSKLLFREKDSKVAEYNFVNVKKWDKNHELLSYKRILGPISKGGHW